MPEKNHFKKVNATDTTWHAAKYIFEHITSSQQIEDLEDNELALVWSDSQWPNNHADPKVMEAIKNHKNDKNLLVNYFPEASEIFRKDILAENIRLLEDLYPGQFDTLIPKSWCLPQEYKKFDKYVKEQAFSPAAQESQNIPILQSNVPDQYYIVKPNDEQRGCGIYITENPSRDLNEQSDVVVSKYIGNPLTVDGFKVDLRIHVLLVSLDPLKIYIHHEGFLRLATEKYEKPKPSNRQDYYMHLTNYSLNKYNKEGLKKHNYNLSGKDFSVKESEQTILRSINSFKHFLEQETNRINAENFAAMGSNINPVNLEHQVWEDIKRIVYKTIIASYEDLKKHYEKQLGTSISDRHGSKAFQILGYDIMLDENYKPWFIEINHNPDLDDDPFIAAMSSRKLICDSLQTVCLEKFGENNQLEMKKVPENHPYSKFQHLDNLFEELDCELYKEELERKADLVRHVRRGSAKIIESYKTLAAGKPVLRRDSSVSGTKCFTNLEKRGS